MDKVYEKSSDLHVRGVYVYKKDADPLAYLDSAKTVKVDAATLKDLFEKGIIVLDGTVEYKPISYSITANIGTLTYVKTDGVDATKADLATLLSI